MILHRDKEKFEKYVLDTSVALNINPTLIEKDYFVVLILRRLNKLIPGLLFKGGTSLSKCFNVIDRFSEDIDLTLDNEHFTQSRKRNANKIIIDACDELGFEILNRDVVSQHSHANYNNYIVHYPALFDSNLVIPNVRIELVFIQKAYPLEIKMCNSYIGEWLKDNKNYPEIEIFNLLPFEINVQTLERTLVDKVFAICDYYLRNESRRNSRHIYDIYQIIKRISFNEELVILVERVRKDRKVNKSSLSAQDDVNVNEVLLKIIETSFFKKDYEDLTQKILIKNVDYEVAIMGLHEIIKSGIFSNKIA